MTANMEIWSVLWCNLMLVALGASKSVVIKLPQVPIVQYAAGPDQLTLLTDNGVRFGYQGDNQFRAERRYPNGTVEGFFTQINADGKMVRTHYTAGTQGYRTSSEIIPDKFPDERPEGESTTLNNEDEITTTTTQSSASDLDDFWNNFTVLLNPSTEVISEENDSISVDAITFTES